ncbi:hypothetical protein IAT38_002280 [Cryptococcus sp. DSM 104549]
MLSKNLRGAQPIWRALSDPRAYLALLKFNRRLPRCPRTNLPVTYSDIGDPQGVPLVYLLPSGCSRWIAASMDPLAKVFGVRMIVVDRPGCGGTGQVPLGERIERSCDMVVSVLEHLGVKPAHILATSAGIYYALHLLTHHPSTFQTSLNPPPRLYLLAPWSPLLPADHPEAWAFRWNWIPTPLIATQHLTTPHIIRAAMTAQKAIDTGLKAFDTGRNLAMRWYKTVTEESPSRAPLPSPSPVAAEPNLAKEKKGGGLGDETKGLLAGMRGGVGEGTDVAQPEAPSGECATGGEGEGDEGWSDEVIDEQGRSRPRLWGRTPCCVACLTSGYMSAENGQGIGQEHLICLNRGPENTDAQWLQTAVNDLAATIEFAQSEMSRSSRDLLARKYGQNGGPVASKAREEAGEQGEAGEGEEEGEESDGKVSGETGRVHFPLEMHVWWGWQDEMVPRAGQLWFNKVVEAYPGAINVTIHDVPDGDHTDLLSRMEGIHQCLQLVQFQGDTTAPTLEA